MLDKVDSKEARPGGEFRFRVTQTTQLSGVSVPAGSIGYGVVREADAAGRHNHDGSLALEPRYIILLRPRPQAGSHVKATKETGTLSRVEVTMNPTLPVVWSPSEPLLQKGISHVPLPVPGIAMTAINTVRWGRNITLGPGFFFSVIPVGNLADGAIC